MVFIKAAAALCTRVRMESVKGSGNSTAVDGLTSDKVTALVEIGLEGSFPVILENWLDSQIRRVPEVADVLSPVLRKKATASYFVRLPSVKYVRSSVASNMRLCWAACDWRALIADGIESCLNLWWVG